MKNIDSRAITFLTKNPVMVLRSARTGIALHVSYSAAGVKWACNAAGLSLYYKNGRVENGKIVSTDGSPLIASDRVFVERFIPRDHNSMDAQTAEFKAIHRAFKLLYPVDSPR